MPVLTCAGLMFMASAIDFVLIFVSLELVTISFYILVAYMRRQTTSLEAGVKYLILSALQHWVSQFMVSPGSSASPAKPIC